MRTLLAMLFLVLPFLHSTSFALDSADHGLRTLTLDEAVSIAVQQNRQVITGRLELEKAEERVLSGEKGYFPVFDVKVSESNLLTSSDYTFQPGAFGVYPGIGPIPAAETKIASPGMGWDGMVMASVGQPLTDLYKVHLNVGVLEADREIAQEKLISFRNTVASDVKRAYYAILQTQSAHAAASELAGSLQELERVVNHQVSQLAELPSELIDVRARRMRAEYDLLTLRHIQTSARQQLNHLLGWDVDTDFTVSLPAETPSEKLDVEAAIALALERRIEVKEGRLRKKQAEYDIQIKRSEYVPQVSLVLSYLTPFNNDFIPANVSTVGLQLHWDVFDWGIKRHDIAAKTRTLKQARQAIREAESAIAMDVRNRVQKLQEAELLIQVTRLTQDAAREKLRVLTNKYREQAVLLQDVLQAQTALADANHQHQAAMLALLTARAEYEQAIGGSP